jgi:uncharacterized protein involved in outer membrane biogenesis
MTQDSNDIQGFDAPPRKLSPKGRLLAGTAIALVGVLVVGGVVAPMFIDQAKYKSLAVEKVREATGYTVDWTGDIGISVFPLPHAQVKGLTVSAGDEKMATMEEADIRIALWPLLDGRVEIADVRFVKPDIVLKVSESGKQSWMTDELSKEGESDSSAAEKSADETAKSGSKEKSFQVGVNSLDIVDGRFSYEDARSGATHVLDGVKVSLAAPDMTGPFSLKGDVVYNGTPLALDLHAQKADESTGQYPVQIKASLPAAKVVVSYSGMLGVGETPKAEGDFSLSSDDLGKTLSVLKGGGDSRLPDELAGAASLQTRIVIDGKDISMPDVHLEAGKQVWAGKVAVKGADGSVTFDLSPEKSGIPGMISSLDLKGQGSLSDGMLTIKDGKVGMDGVSIALDGSVKLPGEDNSRPRIDLAVAVSDLDFDRLSGKVGRQNLGKSGEGEDTKDAGKTSASSGVKLSGFTIPVDGKLDFKAGSITASGKKYSNIKATVAMAGQALTVSDFVASLPAGADLTLKGKVGNTESLSGLDLVADFRADNVESFLTEYDLPKLPMEKKVGSASLNAKIKGSLDQLNVDGRTNLLGFTVSAQGDVVAPMSDLEVKDLKLGLSHANAIEAVRVFQPGFGAGAAWSGPLDLSSTVSWSGKTYKLTGFRGSAGKTSAEGNLTLSMEGSKPSLTGNLSFGDLILANPDGAIAGGEKGGASSSAQKNTPDARARWSREAIDTAWMKAADVDLVIKAKSLVYDYWNLSNANLDFVLSDGALSVKDLSAGMFGGSVAMSGNAKSGSGERDPLNFNLTMKAQNVDAAKLQTALTSKPSDTLTGTLSAFDLNVAGTGLSPAALVQSLNGKGSGNGQNIIVKGIDAAKLAETAAGSFKPLERAGSMFSSFKGGQTEFTTFETAFGIDGGVVNFDKLLFDGPKASLSGAGNVNLPRWTIELKNTVTVKNTDIPPFDFTVSGPLDSPAQVGGSVIENYLKSRIEKKLNKLIEKEIGKRFGVPARQEEQTAPTPDANGSVSPETQEPAETTPEQAIGNIISNPKKIDPNDAAKALEGLFGK